jgi:hypothetical protein
VFRFWVNGKFADGTINAEFIAGSWSFVPATGVPAEPSVTTITLDDPSYIEVDFDTAPAGFQIDPASIADLAAEFSLSYGGAGSIELVNDEAPIRVADTNTWRFRVTGDFVSDGSQTVTLTFGSDATWSFTKDGFDPAPAVLTVATTDNERTYIDIKVMPSVDIMPDDGIAVTIGSGANDSLQAIDTDIRLWSDFDGTAGTPYLGVSLVTTDSPIHLGNNLYRFYLDGQFGQGQVIVEIRENAISDTAGFSNRQIVETFTVEGPTGSIQGPQDGGSIGILSQNSRGFIDVTFGFPGIDPESVFDLAAEFTIVAAAGHSLEVDNDQVPVLISQDAGSATFRYWTIGTYTSGTVTLALQADSIEDEEGSIDTAGITLTVADPTTANLSYIDVRYRATEGNVLDIDSILDAEAEFGLYRDEAGNVDYDAVMLSTEAPVQLTSSNTFRYFFSGDFTAATVWVVFDAGSFLSVETDLEGIQSGTGIGNRVKTESFTVAELTADVIDPVSGTTVDADLLNNRGYIDIDFVAPVGGVAIDVDSVLDADAELAVAEGASYQIDENQAPVQIGGSDSSIFRYWYTGIYDGSAALDLVADSASYLQNDGESVAVTTITSTEGEVTYIDVRYSTAGGIALNEDSILDAGTMGHEFIITGEGFTGTLSEVAPTQLGSSNDDIDNDNDGQIDEADEDVYRYYLDRGFQEGAVSIEFIADSWQDEAGNLGTARTHNIQLIETVKQPVGETATATGQVFYIEISGGIALQGLGFTDEPIIEIRGKVVLEFGDYEVTVDQNNNGTIEESETFMVTRFSLDASGTIKIIKLGNIGSVAARFILQTGDTVSGNPEFWGVAKIQANLDFLKNYGIFAEGSAQLQINTTPTVKTESIVLEGIPGDLIDKLDGSGDKATDLGLSLSGLASSPLADVALPSSWTAILGDYIDPAMLTGATVQTIVTGQKWKIITELPAGVSGVAPVYFVELDSNGEVNLRSEAQTFDLPAQSFSIQILGSLKIKANGSSDPTAEDWVVFSGGFFLRITPTRFEVFITAYAAIPILGLEGQATGLAIIDAELSGPGIPGLALFLNLELSVGSPGDGGGGGGASTIGDGSLFRLEGEVTLMVNTTMREQVFEVPEEFWPFLPPGAPTTLEIYDNAPNLDGSRATDAGADPNIYVTAVIQGSITLFDTITLSGTIGFTASTGQVRISGAISTSIQYLGSLSGSLDLIFYFDREGNGPGVVGRVTLGLEAGGSIPGITLSGQFLLEVNT